MGLPLGLIAKKLLVVLAGKNVLFWALSAKPCIRASSCCESEDNFLKCMSPENLHNSVKQDVSFDVFEQIGVVVLLLLFLIKSTKVLHQKNFQMTKRRSILFMPLLLIWANNSPTCITFVKKDMSKKKKEKFNVTQGMTLLLLKKISLPSNFVFQLILFITNPENNIGYED